LNKVFDRSCFLFIQTNFLFKINQIEKNRQIYKGGSWCKWRGKDVTEISVWWKGLGKELEVDIENLEESET